MLNTDKRNDRYNRYNGSLTVSGKPPYIATIWKPGFRQTTSNNSTIVRAARTHVQHEHFPHSINHIVFWRLCRRPCLETLHNVSSSLDVYLISWVSHKSDSVHVYFQDEKLHPRGLFLTTAQKSFIYIRKNFSFLRLSVAINQELYMVKRIEMTNFCTRTTRSVSWSEFVRKTR